MKSTERKSKSLAFLLRHDKEAFESEKIDEFGWRCVQEFVEMGYTRTLLEEIVDTNNKKRYEFNDDHTMIRARQGHSIQVDVELERMTPLKYLYHGTSKDVKDAILSEGLKSMKRLYVHLSEDVETAINVGKRHGQDVVVFQIDAEQMDKDGYEFFCSRNHVWLTKFVDTKYIHEMK
jgi:putative RNA 2'-phosphotransferase